MSWFQRRAQAESDRAALAAALQQLHLRLEQLEVRVDDARAEAAARQDAWRALIERVGRTEVGLHTTGTQMANHSAVAVVLDSRLAALERRFGRDYQERFVALEQRVASLRVVPRRDPTPRFDDIVARVSTRVDQLEHDLKEMIAATDIVEARMSMSRVANEVARLDIELRGELARAVNHVAAIAGALHTEPESAADPEPARINGHKANGSLPTTIDLRADVAEKVEG